MRAILMAAVLMTTTAIVILGSTAPGVAADLAVVRGGHRHYAAVECPPVPGGVYYGRINRWRARAGECHLDDWQDRPGIDVVWNNWNLW
jgi:hypothetical protein